MSATVTYQDSGLTKLQADLQELRKLKLKIGYQSPDGRQRYDSDITVAKLAAVVEFGGEDTPGRSFIRSTIREREKQIGAAQQRLVADVVQGNIEPLDMMKSLGSLIVGMIRHKLDTAPSWAAPLDPATIEGKGSSKPLEDTRMLIESLSWRVTKTKAGEQARGYV